MLHIYGIASCDTMKKARQWLTDNQLPYIFHDYKKEGISAEQLTDWFMQLPAEKFLNRAGTTYRKLPDDAKTALQSDEEIKAFLVSKPSAIKRPVVVKDGKVIAVGFDVATYSQLISG